jgi:hypothetical protein
MVMYGFNISIGTPPQSVPVALSIETAGTMIQSANCTTATCRDGHVGFNSTESKSFERGLIPFENEFGWVNWEGVNASETISFANTTFEKAPFLFADSVNNIWIDWYFDYDGVVGLAPDSMAWETMVQSPLIEKAVVGIKFPSGPMAYGFWGERNDGELTLGGVDPEFEAGPWIDLPLMNGSQAVSWETRLASLAFRNKTHKLHAKLPETAVAEFISTYPLVFLPPGWGRLLLEPFNNQMYGMIFGQPLFKCELRNQMADVIVQIGEEALEHEIVVSPYEYTFRLATAEGMADDVCVFAVMSTAQINLKDRIILGWPFLRRFYTVLDNEAKRIRREFIPLFCIPSLLIFPVTPKADLD